MAHGVHQTFLTRICEAPLKWSNLSSSRRPMSVRTWHGGLSLTRAPARALNRGQPCYHFGCLYKVVNIARGGEKNNITLCRASNMLPFVDIFTFSPSFLVPTRPETLACDSPPGECAASLGRTAEGPCTERLKLPDPFAEDWRNQGGSVLGSEGRTCLHQRHCQRRVRQR